MKKNASNDHCSLDAASVCAQLGVSRQTLYAYVSRGLVRATEDPRDTRRSLYDKRDVAALVQRKRLGRSRQAVASSTIHWGEPVLKSSITQIIDGEFYYRGEKATSLAAHQSLEAVASRLTRNSMHARQVTGFDARQSKLADPFQRIIKGFSEAVVTTSSQKTEAQLLRMAAILAAGTKDRDNEPIHELLARAWSNDARASDIIRQALVLCADHELNASTYACRIAASAGSSLPACILVGLVTLSGTEHGGLTERCREWMLKAETTTNLTRLIRNQIRRHGTIPGFGHPLYPDGDPRARMLMQLCPLPPRWRSVVEKASGEFVLYPSLDFGLALIERHFALPKGSGLAMFAVGRIAGWIAHAMEQKRTGRLIRPRASYDQSEV